MKSIVVSRAAPLNVTRRGAGKRNERVRIIVSIYYDCMRGYEHEHPHPPVTHCSFSASHDSLEALGLFPAFVRVTRVSVFLTFCASPDTHASAVQSEKTAALGFCTRLVVIELPPSARWNLDRLERFARERRVERGTLGMELSMVLKKTHRTETCRTNPTDQIHMKQTLEN